MTQQPSHADLATDLATLLERVTANGRQAHDGFEAVNARLTIIEAEVLKTALYKARVGAIIKVSTGFITALFAALWWAFHAKIETVLGIGK